MSNTKYLISRFVQEEEEESYYEAKHTCYDCDGTGEEQESKDSPKEKCIYCNGEGWVYEND